MADTSAQRVTEMVQASLSATREGIRDFLKQEGPPLGLTPISDDEFRVFVELQVQKHPPVPIRMEDGMIHVSSPWIVALPFVDGGKAILDRFIRIIEKEGA